MKNAAGDPAGAGGPRGANSKITLERHFEHLGLGTYEARVLVALLKVGTATAGNLAKVSQVTRPNIYPVLESLCAKGLIYSRPDKVTQWISCGRDEVVARLCQARQQGLAEAHAEVGRHGEQAAKILAKMAPESTFSARPAVTIVNSDVELTSLYPRLVASTNAELMVFNKGPYPGVIDVQPEVIAALARGVQTRALYECGEIDDPDLIALRVAFEAYRRVGVEGRVVDSLPMPMAIFDHTTVLLAADDPRLPEAGTPTHIHAKHEQFAALCVIAFETLWAEGRPMSEPTTSGRGASPLVARASTPRSLAGTNRKIYSKAP